MKKGPNCVSELFLHLHIFSIWPLACSHVDLALSHSASCNGWGGNSGCVHARGLIAPRTPGSSVAQTFVSDDLSLSPGLDTMFPRPGLARSRMLCEIGVAGKVQRVCCHARHCIFTFASMQRMLGGQQQVFSTFSIKSSEHPTLATKLLHAHARKLCPSGNALRATTICASRSAQVALCKLLCASSSAHVAVSKPSMIRSYTCVFPCAGHTECERMWQRIKDEQVEKA